MITPNNIRERHSFVSQVMQAYKEELEALEILIEVYDRPIYKEIHELEKEYKEVAVTVDPAPPQQQPLTPLQYSVLKDIQNGKRRISINTPSASEYGVAQSTLGRAIHNLEDMKLIKKVAPCIYEPIT